MTVVARVVHDDVRLVHHGDIVAVLAQDLVQGLDRADGVDEEDLLLLTGLEGDDIALEVDRIVRLIPGQIGDDWALAILGFVHASEGRAPDLALHLLSVDADLVGQGVPDGVQHRGELLEELGEHGF